jgi:tetratricopeptide (TPR) repeat protein
MRLLVVGLLLCGVADAAEPPPTAIAQAEEKLRLAQRERDAKKREQLQQQIMDLAQKAQALDPKDPDAHVLKARAHSLVDPNQPEACAPGACEKAVEELGVAKKLDVNGIAAERISSELGIVLSRLGRYEDALAEYEKAMRRVDPDRLLLPGVWEESSRTILYSNAAETLMALGRLDQAIVRYRQARDAAEGHNLEWQLANWGLGVALDRDEQEDAARQAIARATERDPTLSQLSSEGVFFEPPGDKYYYIALGHEVAGDLQEAIAAWRSYLAAPGMKWTKRARRHLDALVRQKPSTPSTVHVAFAEPESFIGLRSVEELRKTLSEHEDDLELCYKRALRTTPKLRGELLLALDVTPSGLVYPPRVFQTRLEPLIADSSEAAQNLRRCVEMAAQNWRFLSVYRGPSNSVPTENVMVRIQLGPMR